MARLTGKLRIAFRNPRYAARLVVRRLMASSCFRLSGLLNAWSGPPETVNIYPTARCNLKCRLCFARYAASGQELDLGQWEKILAALKRFHPRIHLSGGEPLLYDDILPLIWSIKKHKFPLHITTNGVLLSSFAEQLVRLEVDQIDVSIDGPEKFHDRARGVSGAYERSVAGLCLIGKYRKQRGIPRLRINSIIDLAHPQAMHDLVANARAWGIDSIQFIYPLYLTTGEIVSHTSILRDSFGLKINYWRHADRSRPQAVDTEIPRSVITELSRRTAGIDVEIFPRFSPAQSAAFYRQPDCFYSLIRGQCRAMWNTATILPGGDVESCPDFLIGNCRHDDFGRIWNGAVMKFLRRRIRDDEYFPVCRACCFFYRRPVLLTK